ncbi:MAG: RraA family protein [Thermomicrobiales bacterium]
MTTETAGFESTADRIALFDRMAQELYVAVISDILDSLGYRDQVMRASIQPVNKNTRDVLVGSAATVMFAPQYEVLPSPYTTLIAAIDGLQPGEVAVLATGGLDGPAYWGELFSNAAMARGARGTVIDGYHRDTRQVLDLGYPVYSTGASPLDSWGRATAINYGYAVKCGGVLINPGDIVFAEIDGIVVIPQQIADQVIVGAFEKVAKEDRCRDDLRAGLLLSEVWQKYKVL